MTKYCQKLFLLLISIILLSTLFVFADDKNDTNDPELIARQYINAMKNFDWGSIAKIMNPEDLHKFSSAIKSMIADADSLELKYSWGSFIEDVGGRDALLQLDSVELYTSFLKSSTSGPDSKSAVEMMRESKTTILGHVVEGDDLAHVVYRIELTFMGEVKTKLEIMTLIKHDSQWRVQLIGNPEDLVKSMKKT